MKPKVDFCFKELMEDEEVRRGFVATFLGIDPKEIWETQLIKTHLRKEHRLDKVGVLDICVMLNGMTKIDIEIQVASFPLWSERSLYYLSKLFAEGIAHGDDYDKIEIHILELPKLAKREYSESDLLDWARFLGAECREEMVRMAEKNEYIGKAYERLNYISADEEKRMEYLRREMAIRDHNYLMKENLRQGLSQGRVEGEWLKLISMVRKKYSKGISVEACAEMLEESPDIVRRLYLAMKAHPDWEDSQIYEELSPWQ